MLFLWRINKMLYLEAIPTEKTNMQKKKEIEMLIARYRTDIAALEEKEKDLMRETEILKNLIPSVLVSNTGKVIQTSRDKPFPQHEIEADVRGKMENLKSVLSELQLVVGLVKEEKRIMGKRIEELETLLADQSERYSDKMIDIEIPLPKPEKPGAVDEKHEKESEDLKTEVFDDQRVKFEDLLNVEDTDWKKVCKDLQKQVVDLSENLNNSSQKLMESKSYVKNLEKKYSILKKEHQAQIQLLEKGTDKLISEDVDKDQEKHLQEHGSKGAMQEDLSEIRAVQKTELEKFLADKPEPYPDKIPDVVIPVLEPEKPGILDAIHDKETGDLQIGTMEDQLMTFEELLQSENTDWKKVYGDLQTQVIKLTENLNNSSQKLMESKSYVKNLEEKYSNLKKELQAQIQMLDKRTDSLISGAIGNEPGKYLQIEHESKDIISAMHERLSEIGTVKEAGLKTSLADKPEPNYGKLIDTVTAEPQPDKPGILDAKYENVTDLDIEKLEDQQVTSEELVKPENTDWKKVCEALQKQVIDLTENLNSSSQKLRENESYTKHLEEEYSKLEKELQTKIQLLEKKTDSLISAIVSKEQEKYLQEELESKGAVSAINEALSEVRSMKESLTKSTISKDDFIVPPVKDTDAQDSTSMPKKVPDSEASFSKESSYVPAEALQHKPESQAFPETIPISPEAVSTADVVPPEASVSKQQHLSETQAFPQTIPISHEAVSTPDVAPSQASVSKEKIHEVAKTEVPGPKTQNVPEIPQIPVDAVDNLEMMGLVVPSETLVLKETIPKLAESQLQVSGTSVVPKIPQIVDAANEKFVVSPHDASVIKDTRKNSKGVQKIEIELLIVRYKADIAALEERKEDIMRHIEILENLIPTVVLWYLSKVFQTIEMPSRGQLPFPQDKIKKEAQAKLKHLENVLGDLQQSVEVIQMEEKEMRKRIEELEIFLADQPHECGGTIIDIDKQGPETLGIMDLKHGKEIEDLTTEGLEDQRLKFDELLQSENTDWEKVYQNLLKQRSELSENLKTSSQKLKESEDYAKHLEEEYSMLEKKLKAILKKSTTLSQDTPIEPLDKVTEVYLDRDSKEAISEPAEGQIPVSETQAVSETIPISAETVDIAEGIVAPSEALVSEEAISEKAEAEIKVSQTQSVPEILEDSTKIVDIAEEIVVPTEVVSKEAIHEPDKSHLPVSETSGVPEPIKISPEDTVEELVIPSAEIVSGEASFGIAKAEIPDPETQELPDTLTTDDVEYLVVPHNTLVSKEDSSEVDEARMPESESEVVPDIQPIATETVDNSEVKVAPSGVSVSNEAISKSAEPEIIVSQTQVVPEVPKDSAKSVGSAEGIVAPTEAVSKEAIPEPDKSQLTESDTTDFIEPKQVSPESGATVEETQDATEIQPISIETVDNTEVMVAPSEAIVSNKTISETDVVGKLPASTSVVLATTQIPPEDAGNKEDLVNTSNVSVSKEAIPEPDESHLPESEISVVLETTQISPEALNTAKDIVAPSKASVSKEAISEPAERKSPISQSSFSSGIKQMSDVATNEEIVSPSEARGSKEAVTMPNEAQMLLLESSAPPEIPLASDKVAKVKVPVFSPDISVSKQPHLSPSDITEGRKSEMLMKDSEKILPVEPVGHQKTEVPLTTKRPPADVPAPTTTPKRIESVLEVSKIGPSLKPSELKPPISSLPETKQHEMLASPVTNTVVDEESPSDNLIPSKIAVVPTESVPLKSVTDGIETQAKESQPKDTSREISSRHDLSGIGFEKELRFPSKMTSMPSLAAQTLQGKMRVKDHLIKTMADQLRELSRNNYWAGSKSLEAAMSTDPVKTYDWDRGVLLLYLKGEEPQNYTPTMKSNEDYSRSNPLNVKIVRKLDNDSLLIEWGPPPSAEVVGFQIFLNGQFMYWVHSAKRNLALLHPLDLRLLLEIAVSPIDVRGDVVFRSTIVYKPE